MNIDWRKLDNIVFTVCSCIVLIFAIHGCVSCSSKIEEERTKRIQYEKTTTQEE